MNFKTFVKKILSIQAILIYFGLVTLSISIFYKNRASKLFAEYEREIVQLILLNNRIGGSEAKNLDAECEALKDKFFPFTYFDFSLEEKLNQIINLLKENAVSGAPDSTTTTTNTNTNTTTTTTKTTQAEDLSSLILDFQDTIAQKEISLVFGYDSLMYCSSLLLLISILCIIFKTIRQRNLIKNMQLRNDEQQKISRNLHDGVAQDLAALKFYLQKEDKEKTDFYANQALNEVRYLIGALHLDLSDDFETIIKNILQAFESNYKIKSQLQIASSHVSTLPQNVQIEIIRILQESLSNIARHANASEVTVKFTDVADDFKITIRDNGVGFSIEDIDKLNSTDTRKHYGLHNIQERVKNLGGTVEFVNKGGTTIAITIKDIIR